MWPTQMKAILVLILVLGLSGCGLLGSRACTLELVPGIRIAVIDSLTGTPIGVEIHVIATVAEYADTARSAGRNPSLLSIVDDRPGKYRVEARATGYARWVRSGDVSRGRIGVTSAQWI